MKAIHKCSETFNNCQLAKMASAIFASLPNLLFFST